MTCYTWNAFTHHKESGLECIFLLDFSSSLSFFGAFSSLTATGARQGARGMPQHTLLSSLSQSPTSTMLSLRSRVETWIRDQTARVEATWQIPVLPELPTWKGWQWQWPPWKGREEEKRRIREELELRRKQLQELCRAVKVESVADLQEVLCCMVLAECVYKV